MPKRKHSNTEALRAEFSKKLSAAIKGSSRKLAADKLGISRQMLRLYLKGLSTPGGEVIQKACDEWHLSLSIKGFDFTGEAFVSEAKPRVREARLVEPSLFDLLDKLQKNQIEAEVVGREGDSFYLRFRIKLAA
jgi:transcriptional regulator with XRE-family HTH domain